MTQPTHTSRAGLALIMRLEGHQAAPLALPDGRWLIGYGHVTADRFDRPLSPEEAENLLIQDLAPIEAGLARLVLAPVTQAQFDSLVSFAFSIGLDAFAKSDVRRRLNAGEPIAAACAMDAWRKSAIHGQPDVLDALVRRRTIEKAQFLELAAPIGAPSALVAPMIDHACAILGAPVKLVSMPDTSAQPEVALAGADETAAKLAQILAADPGTAAALRAGLEAEDVEPDDVLVLDQPLAPLASQKSPARLWTSAPATANAEGPRGDITGLSILGIAGFGLAAAGLAALGDEEGVWRFLLFTAAGGAMCLMASYYALKALIKERGGQFSRRSDTPMTIA
jgi:GH24 family phage-related lysozyme (muramidase)